MADPLPRQQTQTEGTDPEVFELRARQTEGESREQKLARLEAEREEKMARIAAEREEKLARLEAERDAQKEQTRREVAAAAALDDEADGLTGTEGRAAAAPVAPPAALARPRRRHGMMLLSFVALVVAPTMGAGWYLWERAADRYASYVGFSVRTEEVGSAIELLGGVAGFSGSSSSDTDILYRFIQSQNLVARIDSELDLRAKWSKADPEVDPVFSYHPPGTIEDLTEYWSRMVEVYSDSGTGLIDVEVQAFTPEDAQVIAQAIYDESSKLINGLSAIARDDATRYAREELDQAVERLKTAREALTRFRNRTQIVDPAASIQSQMGLLSSLQMQLAQTLIDLDILKQSTSAGDPRVAQAERRVEVIRERMQEERDKLGIGSGAAEETEGNAFADLVGEYERLLVDQQFAEQAYTAALAAYDSAVAEARRQSRYLAAHVEPGLPEAARYPARIADLALVALFSFLAWSILVLAAYAIRDRR